MKDRNDRQERERSREYTVGRLLEGLPLIVLIVFSLAGSLVLWDFAGPFCGTSVLLIAAGSMALLRLEFHRRYRPPNEKPFRPTPGWIAVYSLASAGFVGALFGAVSSVSLAPTAAWTVSLVAAILGGVIGGWHSSKK